LEAIEIVGFGIRQQYQTDLIKDKREFSVGQDDNWYRPTESSPPIR
jgi:hypothetical protein